MNLQLLSYKNHLVFGYFFILESETLKVNRVTASHNYWLYTNGIFWWFTSTVLTPVRLSLLCLSVNLTRACGFQQVSLARQSVKSSCLPAFLLSADFSGMQFEAQLNTPAAESNGKAVGLGAPVTAVTSLSICCLDIFVRAWHLKASVCGKSQLIMDHFQHQCIKVMRQWGGVGILTAAVDDLMAGFRTDRDSSFWKVTVAGYLLFRDGSIDTRKVTWGQEAVRDSLLLFALCRSSVWWLMVMHDVLKRNIS